MTWGKKGSICVWQSWEDSWGKLGGQNACGEVLRSKSLSREILGGGSREESFHAHSGCWKDPALVGWRVEEPTALLVLGQEQISVPPGSCIPF